MVNDKEKNVGLLGGLMKNAGLLGPQLVDKLSPEGKAPEGAGLEQMLGGLLGQLR
jgi:hypothetical protein